MFCQEFGIRPWEWDRLDVGEMDALIDYADDLIKQQQKASRNAS